MELTEVISQFKIDGEPNEIQQLTAGNINRTYKVRVGEKYYILQNINVNVFRDPDALMNNITGVCEHLRSKLPPTANPMRETMNFIDTHDNKHYFLDDTGKYWRMYIFIDAISYQSIEKPGLFYKAGKAFGNFQSLLSDYPAEELAETIPNFHNTPKRYEDFENAIKNCKLPERLEQAKELINEYVSRKKLAYAATDPMDSGEMPIRVTHNDTKLNNILMDEKTDEGLCVIDLDTVMPGSVLYDFGDAIRFGASTAAEDEPDVSKISLDLELFDEFTHGFVEGTKGALNECELSLLPEGAMLMTYECGMRFLGDYLNGDTYFKINYPEHNFIRARAQITLLIDMEKKLAQMHEIVNKYSKENT